MSIILGKVTVFITREFAGEKEILLLRHPNSGIQIPGGTIEDGETPEHAARREALEETGLDHLSLCANIGKEDDEIQESKAFVVLPTDVYSRPDLGSFNWAHLRTGLTVDVLRSQDAFTHVRYLEYDSFPEMNYETYVILGWVPKEALSRLRRRHYFHFECRTDTEDRWTVTADNHLFELFWTNLAELPQIVSPQDKWIPYVNVKLNYDF
jgi:8-oxo-dGTP pyrophosphatase MutT (NUDIX family)